MAGIDDSGYLDLDELRPAVEQCGHWRFDKDHWFRYRNPCYHLILVETGRIVARTVDGPLAATAGDLVCFQPAEVNEYGTRGPTSFLQVAVYFAPPPHHRRRPWLGDAGPLPAQVTLGNGFAEVRAAFETACLEIVRPGAGPRLRLAAAMLGVLAVVADVLRGDRRAPTALDDWQRLRLQLEATLDEEVSVRDLAATMGLSTDHFIREFRRRFGVTPKARHTHLRLAEAARLLRVTDRQVKEIAYAIGYADPRTFARAFQRHFHVRPSDLRPTTPADTPPPVAGALYPMNVQRLPPPVTG